MLQKNSRNTWTDRHSWIFGLSINQIYDSMFFSLKYYVWRSAINKTNSHLNKFVSKEMPLNK
jgi:hypothetical protein